MSRRRTSLARSSSECLSGDDCSGSLANHIAKGENVGRAAIAQLFGHIEGPALAVADPPARVVGGETYLR